MIPWWVKWAALGLAAVALYFVYHHWVESIREEGRLEVRLEWADALKEQEARELAAAKAADEAQAAKEAQRVKDFAALRVRNKALEARLATACVDPAIVDGLRESIRAANQQGPGEPAKGAAPAARPPDGNQLNDWFANVAELYRACREQVIGWIEWDDNRVKGRQ